MSPRDAALAALTPSLGTEIGVANWITVDQAMIDRFGETTQDDQWIHMDVARAAASPFGGTIAHGFLTLSLAARFSYDCFQPLPAEQMAVNYGLDRVRFVAPVPAGARVRGRFTLKEVRPRDTAGLLRICALSVEIEGHTSPALVADLISLLVFEEDGAV